MAEQVRDADAAAPIAAQLGELARQIRDYEGEREQALARRAAWEAAQRQLTEVQARCRELAGQIRDATFERKRELLELLDVKVRLYERRHEPRWEASAWLPAYPPGAAEPAWTYRTFQSFQLLWRRKSVPRSRPSSLAKATIALIQQLARDNPLWGAERIRGELLKLGIRVSKRTIQKYTRLARPTRPPSQMWGNFLRNHGGDIWACAFLQVTDLLLRPLFVCCLVGLASRRVVHVGVKSHPTDAWAAQQLREATPYGERPRFLLRDNDGKFGARFARLAEASDIAVVRTPVRAPRANAIAERFLRSVRQECLDHPLPLGEGHLRRALRE